MKFFNDFKEELTRKKTIMEKGESEEENYKNSFYDDYEDEKESKDNYNLGKIKHYNNIKSFKIDQNDLYKISNSFDAPFDFEKEDRKNDEKAIDDLAYEDNQKMNYINKINNNELIKKNSNNLVNSNTITNINNKNSLNIDNIKLNFQLKDAFKSGDDMNTIYNNSDVDSEYTILNDDKILRDDNIISANNNNGNNVLIKECINKNFSSLKQLLLCSRTVINNAHDMIQTFSSCYEWISENYLKEHINKKLIEEEKERQRRQEKAYDTKNNVARKKKTVKKKI
jgi:hypothetical protein